MDSNTFTLITTVAKMIFFVPIGIVLIINIINPRILWEKFESWKAASEPSPAFFRVRRISSLVILAIILYLFFSGTIPFLRNFPQ